MRWRQVYVTWGRRCASSASNKPDQKFSWWNGSPGVFPWMVIPLGMVGYYVSTDIKAAFYSMVAPFNVVAVAMDISDVVKKYGCGPMFLRLCFQSACLYDSETGTGKFGVSVVDPPYSDMPCCRGLDRAIALLRPVKEAHPGISWSDLVALAGAVAVEEMGGPRVSFRYGRKDVAWEGNPQDLVARCPSHQKGLNHVKAIFHRMGLTRTDTVVLMGAHTVGRMHKLFTGFDGQWTEKPCFFDNSYYLELMDIAWKLTSDKGPAHYIPEEDGKQSNLAMLSTDLALLSDPSYKTLVRLFAGNEDVWLEQFASSFQKLCEVGWEDQLRPTTWSFFSLSSI
eukprot:Sspe_Gene.118074::Locus_110671_Transcript_1_1_Confidence_1.000_Length_1099::g.118074::m.118074